jgi:acyl carrier protein
MDQINKKLVEIFRDVFEQPELEINAETSPADVIGWDSFGHINLIVTIEAAFNIKLSSDDIGKIRSVRDIVNLLSS